MAILYDLPNELFDLIAASLHPRDLDALLQISKRLRQKLGWLLTHHLDLKVTYSKFTYHDGLPRGAPARLLKAIMLRPRIASYVMNLDAADWELGFSDNRQEGKEDDRQEYSTEDLDLFNKALMNSKYFDQEASAMHELLKHMDFGDEELILVLLLTLLPNLEHVRFSNVHHIDFGLTPALIAVEQPIQCLTRLASLHIDTNMHDYDDDWNDWPTLLGHLWRLPALKIFSMNYTDVGLFAYPDQQILTLYPPDLVLSLTHLTLTYCFVPPIVVCELLRRCSCLEVLKYSRDDGADHDNGFDFDPESVLEALKEHCTGTLKSLKMIPRCREPVGFMGSLQSFHKLEALITQFNFLVGPAVDTKQTNVVTPSPHLRNDNPFHAKELHLLSSLPPQLTKLTLHVDAAPQSGSSEDKRLTRNVMEAVTSESHSLETATVKWPSGSMVMAAWPWL